MTWIWHCDMRFTLTQSFRCPNFLLEISPEDKQPPSHQPFQVCPLISGLLCRTRCWIHPPRTLWVTLACLYNNQTMGRLQDKRIRSVWHARNYQNLAKACSLWFYRYSLWCTPLWASCCVCQHVCLGDCLSESEYMRVSVSISTSVYLCLCVCVYLK